MRNESIETTTEFALIYNTKCPLALISNESKIDTNKY